ncbi:cytosolic 5'-nucleotidase 1A isoform X2 [Lingula anatina]|uniref:Cytosolic 5'-nucleotidase 1A isoform X2 n=1 Tax=Lingula anatina TaxID=7574 RepID=A0A1S3IQC3_LINAN|nr:cytosolic 5'-nucleotidase 1A isoform X2 [Lingula anatina]|eukprot:XP_013400111.1 cytosolic 5'-nucleotidase 1A isoform X2 [Lingula anatina]
MVHGWSRDTPAVKIAVSSRALFDQTKEYTIFKEQGVKAYTEYHHAHEEEILEPGTAFPFIKAAHTVNAKLKEAGAPENELFEIVLMSHNQADTAGIRLIRSIHHHGLKIDQMCLTDGASLVGYLKAYDITLYLSSHTYEVQEALKAGFGAAAIFPQKMAENQSVDQLRIVFDCDAVLFSDEAEQIFQTKGLGAFLDFENERMNEPLPEGPLKPFAVAIGKMQKRLEDANFNPSPIRTYIVTARSSSHGSGIRTLKTLRSWGLKINECNFLCGRPKGPVLSAIKAHIFFDDTQKNIESAHEYGVPSGHVNFGEGVSSRAHSEDKQSEKQEGSGSTKRPQPHEDVATESVDFSSQDEGSITGEVATPGKRSSKRRK